MNLLNVHACSAPCLISVQHACAAGLTDVVSLSSDAVRVFSNLINTPPSSVHGSSFNANNFDNVPVVPISDRNRQ